MRDVIQLDVDSSLLPLWKEEWVRSRRAYLAALGYTVTDVVVRPSGYPLPWRKQAQPKKRGGFHAWIHLEVAKLLSDMEKLKLQFLLGDDVGRVWINYLRITKRNHPHWNKIFGYIVARSPQPEPCNTCKLRMLLEEIDQNVCDESKPEKS